MTTDQFSPGPTVTRAEFITALIAMDVNGETIKRLNTPEIPEEERPDTADALYAFRCAGATPKKRSAIAKAMSKAGVPGCSYADLTQWVIRSDLMRVEGIDKDEALALAEAGIVGVHDLRAVLEDEPRRLKLKEKLYEAGLETFFTASLRGKCEAAAKTPDIEPIITDTQVLMVVKGAGNQKRNDTLRAFMKGFWPAVEQLDPNAKRRDRYDVFPADFNPSPLDNEPDTLVTEIKSGERRIWVRETFWEAALKPLKPLEALTDEWTMATYTLGYFVYKLLFRYDSRIKGGEFHQYIRSFWLMYFMLLLPGLLFLFDGRFPFPNPDGMGASNVWAWIGAAALLSFTAAIRPARKMADNQKNRERWQSRWPSIEGWVLWLLIAGVFIEFKAYILFVVGLFALELAMLAARSLAWPFRSLANSDTASTQYFKYEVGRSSEGDPIYRTGKRERRDMKISQILYRYIAVMGLPVAFLIVYLSYVLQQLDVFGLGDIGRKVGEIAGNVLSGVLGDVVSFAMHPEQAQNVRSLVANELRHFNRQDDVSGIHIFCHSNGTPITYDTLFNHIEDDDRKKLITYVTIGSVLNYMAQSNEVLQDSFFPTERRFRGRYPSTFPKQFKWFNFWNLVDPITEFYGLDDYVYMSNTCVVEFDDRGERVELKRVKYPEDPEDLKEFMRSNFRRHPVSPTNIKSRAVPLKNHSEYWSNVPEIHTPFAKRVLGELYPPEWTPEPVKMDWKADDLEVLPDWVNSKYLRSITASLANLLFSVYEKAFDPVGKVVFRLYQGLRNIVFRITKRVFKESKLYWSDFQISFHSFFVYVIWFLIVDVLLIGGWITAQYGGDIVGAFSPLLEIVRDPALKFWDENMNPVITQFANLFFPKSDEPSIWQFLKDAYDTVITFANDPTVDNLRKNLTLMLLGLVTVLQIFLGASYKSPYERGGKEARPSARRS